MSEKPEGYVNLDPEHLDASHIKTQTKATQIPPPPTQAEIEAANIPEPTELRTPMAQASYSRLDYYKNCPLAFKFKYVDRLAPLQEPEHKDKFGNVKPPGWQRGSIIHQAMDDYINSRTNVLRPELYDLRFELNEARQLKIDEPERILTEQNKFFDFDYNLIDMDALTDDEKGVTSAGDPCPSNYHVLVIIDLLIFNEDFTHATIVDLKSGKVYPVKHAAQTQLYALFTAMEYPQVENVTTQLWYCDQSGKIVAKDFTRERILMYFNFWHRSISRMHKDYKFLPSPHEQHCFFCEWGKKEHSNKWKNKTGNCELSLDKRDRI